jgi:hypothetical protein
MLMQCFFRSKITPDNNQSDSDSSIRRERVLKNIKKHELIKMLISEEEISKVLRANKAENEFTISECRKSALALRNELVDLKQKKETLELAMSILKTETEALKEEMQTMKYDFLSGPGDKSAEFAEMMIAIEPMINNLRKCLSDPIQLDLLDDPVITSSGHTFDNSSLSTWMRTRATCPITNMPLRCFWGETRVIKNHTLRQIMPHFKALELAVKNVMHPRFRNAVCQTSAD